MFLDSSKLANSFKMSLKQCSVVRWLAGFLVSRQQKGLVILILFPSNTVVSREDPRLIDFPTMPQGDYIQLHPKRYGYRHDHFQRKRKEARQVHKHSALAQKVNVSELGLVTPAGKVVWEKYAEVTTNPENDGCINAVLLVQDRHHAGICFVEEPVDPCAK